MLCLVLHAIRFHESVASRSVLSRRSPPSASRDPLTRSSHLVNAIARTHGTKQCQNNPEGKPSEAAATTTQWSQKMLRTSAMSILQVRQNSRPRRRRSRDTRTRHTTASHSSQWGVTTAAPNPPRAGGSVITGNSASELSQAEECYPRPLRCITRSSYIHTPT